MKIETFKIRPIRLLSQFTLLQKSCEVCQLFTQKTKYFENKNPSLEVLSGNDYNYVIFYTMHISIKCKVNKVQGHIVRKIYRPVESFYLLVIYPNVQG